MTDNTDSLVERLNAYRDSGQFTIGGATLDATGKGTSWGCQPIKVLVNPDGPEAAAALTAKDEQIARLTAENERLREIVTFDCIAFPDMEEAAIKWANKISGLRGQPCHHPDPVGILEMCEDIARTALEQSNVE